MALYDNNTGYAECAAPVTTVPISVSSVQQQQSNQDQSYGYDYPGYSQDTRYYPNAYGECYEYDPQQQQQQQQAQPMVAVPEYPTQPSNGGYPHYWPQEGEVDDNG